MHQLQELVRLHRLGTGAREVARLLGVSPNTARVHRERGGPVASHDPEQ
jgi:DNA-binding CsgD family transcriptional regulator